MVHRVGEGPLGAPMGHSSLPGWDALVLGRDLGLSPRVRGPGE